MIACQQERVDEKLLQAIPGTSGYMTGKAINLNYGAD
jgi:hypothetical protein